jgi:hypothetical protein
MYINISDVRQIGIHTPEWLVRSPNHCEVEIAIAKLKKYKCLGSDQILAKVIQARGETLVTAVHKIINSIWDKEE